MRRGRATCGPGSGAGHAQRAHRLRGSLRTGISLGAAKRGGRCWRPGAAPGRAPSTCKNFPSGGDAPLVPQHQPPGHPGTGSCLLRATATHVSPLSSCLPVQSRPHTCPFRGLSQEPSRCFRSEHTNPAQSFPDRHPQSAPGGLPARPCPGLQLLSCPVVELWPQDLCTGPHHPHS